MNISALFSLKQRWLKIDSPIKTQLWFFFFWKSFSRHLECILDNATRFFLGKFMKFTKINTLPKFFSHESVPTKSEENEKSELFEKKSLLFSTVHVECSFDNLAENFCCYTFEFFAENPKFFRNFFVLFDIFSSQMVIFDGGIFFTIDPKTFQKKYFQ